MTCPFPFVFFFFTSSAVQLTGSTFLLGSHELHTQHITNRLVVRFHLFRRFFGCCLEISRLFFSFFLRGYAVSSVAAPPVVAP